VRGHGLVGHRNTIPAGTGRQENGARARVLNSLLSINSRVVALDNQGAYKGAEKLKWQALAGDEKVIRL
jgi:hypothetical protein